MASTPTRRGVVWPILVVIGLWLSSVTVSCGIIGGLGDFREVDCIGNDCMDGGGASDGQGNADTHVEPADSGAPPELAIVGGTVGGLKGTGLVLRDNDVDDLPISADGPFLFPAKIRNGATYAVTVSSQPSSPTQTCSIARGAGTITGHDVADVGVSCSTASYSIGVNVVGLSGVGLVLSNNGVESLQIPPTGGTFTFPTRVASGASFAVEITAQPTISGPCSISGATGVVGVADVTGVLVNCNPNTYTVGGTITGLTGTAVLRNNGANGLTVTSSGSFAFSQTLSSGATYAVTVFAQPSYPPKSQTCTVVGGSGAIGSANVTKVAITCATNAFKVGGLVAGLTGTLVLEDNGVGPLTLTANGPFSFGTAVPSGATYAVTVLTQPIGQSCTITKGSGTVANADVATIVVSCVASCGALNAPCSPGGATCCGANTCQVAGAGYKCLACVQVNGFCMNDADCCNNGTRCGNTSRCR